jgi:hypothetical protein
MLAIGKCYCLHIGMSSLFRCSGARWFIINVDNKITGGGSYARSFLTLSHRRCVTILTINLKTDNIKYRDVKFFQRTACTYSCPLTMLGIGVGKKHEPNTAGSMQTSNTLIVTAIVFNYLMRSTVTTRLILKYFL